MASPAAGSVDLRAGRDPGLGRADDGIGLFYRASAAAVFLTWGYLWVVESTRTYWQSHYYLETLLAFLMIWMPAARKYSVDAWLARGQNLPRTVPYWTLFLLRGQLVIAYFYAGVAKLNADWLLDAVPVRWYLQRAHVTAPYEPFLTSGQIELVKGILHSAQFAYFISYTGVIFDLAVGLLLLVRRTRIFGIILMVLFHATNHFLIFDDIDWFPLIGATTALIFLDADWPERLWTWLRHPRIRKPDWDWFTAGAILFPLVGASLGWKLKASRPAAEPKERLILDAAPRRLWLFGWRGRRCCRSVSTLHSGRRPIYLRGEQFQLAIESGRAPCLCCSNDRSRRDDSCA